MAKRRNLKKEKALRNLAYARKFRKRTNSVRTKRRQGNPNSAQDMDDMDQDMNQDRESAGAAE